MVFFRAEDTVIKDHAHLVDQKRVFYSDIRDDNPLDCIVSKVEIVQVAPNVDLAEKDKTIPPCDLYYDMSYSLKHLTFANIVTENSRTESDVSSTISSGIGLNSTTEGINSAIGESSQVHKFQGSGMTLLDLYSGCEAMSTGLCLGASLSGLKLVTRWAVDINPHACESLKLNHPKTEVRNEAAEDFLSLLKEWATLCEDFSLLGSRRPEVLNPISNRSGSEDNVYKSIKYGVWVSTPNGNKRLYSAFHEAKEKQGNCPIFLLFSVNASAQFCGVAEMVGPVDYDKSVDYWKPQVEWGLQGLASLTHFSISGGCQDLDSFPKECLLPTTFTSLHISGLPNLKSLDSKGFHLLTSLQKLQISDCPMLQSLPEEGLPTSISFLKISNCLLLKHQCHFGKGKIGII